MLNGVNSLMSYLGSTRLNSNYFYYTTETKSSTGDPMQDWVDGIYGTKRYTSCIHGSGGYLYQSVNVAPYVRGITNIE